MSLHVGQTGVRIGSSLWQLLSHQHSLHPDGSLTSRDQFYPTSMFSESSSGKLTPRCVFTDLEPTIVVDIRRGAWGGLYQSDCFVTDKEDGASNYARGNLSVGRGRVGECLDRIRKEVEGCESLQGLMISHSVGGGTGAGFTALLNQHLRDLYKHKTKLQFTVFPSPHISPIVVEPYNTTLYMSHALDACDSDQLTVLLDNESLYKVAQREGMELPDYYDINHLIGRIVASVTAPIRLAGPQTVDLDTIQTNLVPYPRISYVTASLSPNCEGNTHHSVSEMTVSCFGEETSTLGLDRVHGKVLSSCLLYQGAVTPGEVNTAIRQLSALRTLKTTSWVPCPFKVGIVNQSPNSDPVLPSVCALTNHTGLETTIESIIGKFERLYRRRAFCHFYHGEGLGEDEFRDGLEQMSAWEKDYMYENHPYQYSFRYRYRGEGDEDSDSDESEEYGEEGGNVETLVRIRGRGE